MSNQLIVRTVSVICLRTTHVNLIRERIIIYDALGACDANTRRRDKNWTSLSVLKRQHLSPFEFFKVVLVT